MANPISKLQTLFLERVIGKCVVGEQKTPGKVTLWVNVLNYEGKKKKRMSIEFNVWPLLNVRSGLELGFFLS